MTENPTVGPERLDIETHDAGSTAEALRKTYSCTQIQQSGGHSAVRITRGWLGRITLDTLKFSGSVTYDAPSLGRVCICRVHSGHIETRIRGGALETSSAGDLIIFPASKERYSGQIHQAHFDLTILDIAEFNRLAPSDHEAGVGSIRFTCHKPISSVAANRLSRFIDFLQIQMLATPNADQSPLLTAMAAQGLAATVLAALPNTAVAEPTSTDHRDDQQPAILRRAITFIAENAQSDLTLADIAAAVNVTPRAVQYMFRNHLGISPMEHLRRTRLHRAHRDLIKSDEATTTVGDIARQWGFTNYTRFVARYKNEYNCSPEKTLHSS